METKCFRCGQPYDSGGAFGHNCPVSQEKDVDHDSYMLGYESGEAYGRKEREAEVVEKIEGMREDIYSPTDFVRKGYNEALDDLLQAIQK